MQLTLEQFQQCTGCSAANAQTYCDFAVAAMERFRIENDVEASAFLATLSVECELFTHMEEDLFYTHADHLVEVFPREFKTAAAAAPYVRNPQGLSKFIYNGFHGRGGIQLSWEKNYKIHGDNVGADYVGNPSLLLTPEHAMLSAGSYWDLTKCNAVAHDMGEVTLRVNGPQRRALANRIAQRDIALRVLA